MMNGSVPDNALLRVSMLADGAESAKNPNLGLRFTQPRITN
jgi:hypothetical protein